ncbi:hypothetical protein [Agromyces italicus]|uniref:phosphotriesterase family protein n=1 Tax=Agromyces italicus TaxID=279572 RepID=UPI0003B562DE|nr:hypothetical protein [Agromyces italicus]
MAGPRTVDPIAGSIRTVLGPVAPSALGATVAGEHLVSNFATPDDTDAGWARIGRDRPRAATEVRFARLPVSIDTLGRLAMGAYNDDDLRLDEVTALAGAQTFAANGGGTIVELTAFGCSPDPSALARVARHAGVHIVRAAGWHEAAWSPELAGASADDLSTRIVAEIDDDPHPAGVVVVGPFRAADASSRALLEAAGRAAITTGAPLVLRIDEADATLGLRRSAAARSGIAPHRAGSGTLAPAERIAAAHAALDRLLAAGIAGERIALADASCLLARPGELDAALDRGVQLLFDGLGRIPTARTEVADHDVALAVLSLAERGVSDRVLLGSGIAQKHRLAAFGGNGYEFVPARFAPYLGMLGADAELLDAVTERNAARFLAFSEVEPIA